MEKISLGPKCLEENNCGAGTATVTKALAQRVNEGAAPGDVVSGEALRQRSLDISGEKKRICSNGTNNPTQPEPKNQEEEQESIVEKSHSEATPVKQPKSQPRPVLEWCKTLLLSHQRWKSPL
ncbi:hypothetical protein [Desulfogranum marinum]|uniref:hypothetical protein n=1 Tax=Desulfogranum marinum TaxID=453220 RepID=UPI001965EE4D|nr:hypothetical protein [Desulfogranum marinum]MBM9512330.1 hypothetical protein [Desulfogranum marinum]